MSTTRLFSVALLPLLMLATQHCDEGIKPKTELEKLPPATQSGKRTFGCLVDGKAWVIEGITDAQGFYQTGTLFISAGVTNKMFYSDMALHIFDLDLKEGAYPLAERLNQADSDDALFSEHVESCEYLTTSIHTGILTITHLDKVNFIISGTFAFDAFSTDCSKVVKITDGRFDIHYAP
jgi:hypothetical protein